MNAHELGLEVGKTYSARKGSRSPEHTIIWISEAGLRSSMTALQFRTGGTTRPSRPRTSPDGRGLCRDDRR